MDTSTWITILLALATSIGALLGLIFLQIRSSILRLDSKLDRTFERLDKKIDMAKQESHTEARDVRQQVQDLTKMLANQSRVKDDTY